MVYPLDFGFRVTAFELPDEQIQNPAFMFVRIQGTKFVQGGAFYMKETWVPQSCLINSNYYLDKECLAGMLTCRLHNIIYSDVDISSLAWGDFEWLYMKGSHCGDPDYGFGPPHTAEVIDQIGKMLKLRFDKPLLLSQVWVPYIDLLLHEKLTGKQIEIKLQKELVK